jgi:hypothetical protein
MKRKTITIITVVVRNDVCSCEVGSVRRPPIARLFSLGAACGVQVQMVEL